MKASGLVWDVKSIKWRHFSLHRIHGPRVTGSGREHAWLACYTCRREHYGVGSCPWHQPPFHYGYLCWELFCLPPAGPGHSSGSSRHGFKTCELKGKGFALSSHSHEASGLHLQICPLSPQTIKWWKKFYPKISDGNISRNGTSK